MLVLVATLYEFLQFLKIVMWISIPLFLISTLVVLFLHYRKKKKNGFDAESEQGLEYAFSTPSFAIAGLPVEESGFAARLAKGQQQYKELENDLVKLQASYANLFSGTLSETQSEDPDRKGLEKQIKQYELKITQLQQAIDFLTANSGKEEDYEKARKSILEKTQEIKRLSSIVEQLNREIALLTQQNESKNSEIQKLDRLLKTMQESARLASTDARDLQLSFQQQSEDKEKSHFEENKRLAAQLKELHEKFRSLEEENKKLQESLLTNDTEEMKLIEVQPTADTKILEELLVEARAEINRLKDQLVNTDSMEEIIQEKKAEIEFLQQQLEQRIRLGKNAEQKLYSMESINSSIQKETDNLRQELNFLREESTLRHEDLKNRELQIEDGTKENRSLKKQLMDAEDRLLVLGKEQENSKNRLADFEKEIQRKQELIDCIHQQITEQMNIPNRERARQNISASLPHLAEQASI